MQKVIFKRYILPIVVLAVAILAICLGALFAHSVVAENSAGNNAGSASGQQEGVVSIVLDVNGKVQESDERDNNSAILIENNSKQFRKRYIHSVAIVGDDVGDYFFDKTTIINSCPNIDVTVNSDDDSGLGQGLQVEALSMIETGNGYFSVELKKSKDDKAPRLVKFSVTVYDTFVACKSNQSLYVGYNVNADGLEFVYDDHGNPITQINNKPVSSLDGNKHEPILTVYNFAKLEIDLDELLKGRALYLGTTALTDGSTKKWTVKSVTNFAIESVSFAGLTGLSLKDETKSSSISGNPPIRVSPKISGKVEVDSDTILTYSQTHDNADFWAVTHELEISLKLVSPVQGYPNTAKIILPFRFAPANPQRKEISANILRLNVTSKNAYDLSARTVIKADPESDDDSNDYCSIYVRPGDLMEYSAPQSYRKSYFHHASTTLNGKTDIKNQDGLVIERVKSDYTLDEDVTSPNLVPEMYKITAKKSTLANSSFTIKFNITYFNGPTSDDGHSYERSIDITTYGGYQIKFAPINGKKAVTYNALNSSVFAAMRDRGYLLTNATSLNDKQLAVTFKNNVLTLDPKVKSIKGETTARVLLEFTNNNRQKITFESEIIDINVDAGSLFARFDDWQAWLIIAACVIGGIIVILFIVWIFIHALSKRKQDELAMQAPVSSYIVKLNSTIAATQAQQRMAQTQALSQASAQMLLGAGPTTGAVPMPDTLQLATGMPSSPLASTPSTPLMSEPQATVPPESDENLEELIAKYITDDELLERIFTEKYEPKGMVRRTFFKSKDLQARELDKEKKRIIERYKTPMPMDEAIMSETEIKKAAASSTPSASSAPMETEPEPTELFVLDFDPDAPLYVEEEKPHDEFTEEKIDLDVSPEESRFKALEHRNEVLSKELAELKSRLDKVQTEVNNAKSMEDELREKITKAEADDEQFGKDIEELEFKLASAKNRDKEKITRDISIKEEKKQRNIEELERLRAELDRVLGGGERINGIYVKLDGLQQQKTAELETVAADLEKAKAEYEAYLDRLEKVKKRQELEAKVTSLVPLLEAVNNTDYEMRRLDKLAEEQAKERETLKAEVAQAKSQILGATDFGLIADLNAQISDANARLSELEREITKGTKQKSDMSIEFNSQRRKANDFVEKNEIPLEDVIRAEDGVIGAIEFGLLKAIKEKDKEESEKAVATAHAVYDDLSASANDVTMIAMEVAGAVSELEEELQQVQAQYDEITAQMETATEDEKLDLMVTQGDTSDKLEELKAKLEQTNVEGTKRKMEAQAKYDEELEAARAALDRANDDFEQVCASYDELINNTDPLDLIRSGTGVISQDQKKYEAENLKKQLERSKNEIEQARLAAQQAQMEAEEARRRAQEESEEARQEAERLAQEAIERAEQARLEAEEKAKADIAAAELAQQQAAEALAAEAEEARRKAQEESEEAKRLAEEQAEEARRKAQEESEEAKRKAQEEIEEMRRKAEEEAEAKRLEEENKRKEDEERQKAEAARADAVAKKVALRKDQIITIRNEMKELKSDVEAKNLRERLYNLQLSFDEDERNSTELMDFYNKTMDDIQNSGEIARLKAENAKKPQRVVRKVTERVNRIPRRKPGARPGARPASGARPGARAGARPGARPAARPGARPAGSRPGAKPGARPAARPGARPTRPGGSKPGKPKQ